nr:thioredoxin domain-containing protein [Streptomyces sp. YIM 98790]
MDALSDPEDFAAFEEAVTASTFAPWAVLMAEKFAADIPGYGVTGTPGVVLNGEKVATPANPDELHALLSDGSTAGSRA